VRRCGAIVTALGERLSHTPDDKPESGELIRLFHRACDMLQRAETKLEELRKGPRERA
jgi:hypothetical protein